MGNGNSSKLKIKVKNLPLDVEINTSGSIIYLVGKNGAGKSRFIEGLRDSKGQILINPETKSRKDIPFRFFEWGSNQSEHNFLESAQKEFKDLNKTLELSEQQSISFDERIQKGKIEIIDGQRKRNDEVLEQPVRNGIDFIGTEHFSDGTNKLHNLINWTINEGMKGPILPVRWQRHTGQLQLLVVGLEEPENSFHPKIQKKIPSLLHTWILNQRVRQPILLIVSTHSPFIIKGASEFRDTQRVYGIEDCQMIDLTGKDESEIASFGVSGSQSLITSNNMLGAGIGDLFPNPILMAENSVSELLISLSESVDFAFDEFIVNPQGDGDIEERIGNLQKMSKVFRKMQKSFPERELFNFKIIIVVDDITKATELQAKFNNVNEFEIEAHGIGQNQLEDVYPQNYIDEFIASKSPKKKSWDKSTLINEYLTSELEITGTDKGIFKKDLAKFVSSKIKNKAELNRDLLPVAELLTKIGIK